MWLKSENLKKKLTQSTDQHPGKSVNFNITIYTLSWQFCFKSTWQTWKIILYHIFLHLEGINCVLIQLCRVINFIQNQAAGWQHCLHIPCPWGWSLGCPLSTNNIKKVGRFVAHFPAITRASHNIKYHKLLQAQWTGNWGPFPIPQVTHLHLSKPGIYFFS